MSVRRSHRSLRLSLLGAAAVVAIGGLAIEGILNDRWDVWRGEVFNIGKIDDFWR